MAVQAWKQEAMRCWEQLLLLGGEIAVLKAHLVAANAHSDALLAERVELRAKCDDVRAQLAAAQQAAGPAAPPPPPPRPPARHDPGR